MSAYSSRYQRRHILLSSDLPPSDLPEYIESDNEKNHAEKDEDNPFLTDNEDTSMPEIPIASSDDFPLEKTSKWTYINTPLEHSDMLPTSEDIPLASIRHQFPPRRSHMRSSSLPIPSIDNDEAILTPTAERHYRMQVMTTKRLQVMTQNRERRSAEAAAEKEREAQAKHVFFDKILASLHRKHITLAEFLKYTFNPATRHIFDWRWRGFFQQKETVTEILGYWTAGGYNQTTQLFISKWIIENAQRIVGQESKAISESKILRKTSMVVNEAFFLDYSLESLIAKIWTIAPSSFAILDVFSTTPRQKKELKEKSRKKQELVCSRFSNLGDRVQDLREPRLAAEKRREASKKTQARQKKANAGTDANNANALVTLENVPTDLQGDIVFENACLFMRDALLTRLFADCIKSGDSGRVIMVLKQWAFSYRGNGRMKYAHEMLHLLHNLTNVWTEKLRKVVTNNWLLNPTGRENMFVEIDLVQEHLNFWIKSRPQPLQFWAMIDH
ncbi:hypothetical protein B0H34DRAFT_799948 [Crassisporium funariophilum]|nr:hypothetical protein B0H34DRAFT_799948 [Crassisporium funariophilum]